MGQYGPENTGRIHFWWDMLVVALFSLVIFYWAMAAAQSHDEIEASIAQQAGGDQDWEAQVAEASGATETPSA